MTGGVGMIEDAKLGGGHVGMPHELLGEDLARLDLGGLAGWTEDTEPSGLKLIDDAQGQRLFRPDDGEADLFLLREAHETLDVVGFDGHIDAVSRCAGVAGRTKDPLDARRLSQLPDQGMFATALADDEDLHATRSFFHTHLSESERKSARNDRSLARLRRWTEAHRSTSLKERGPEARPRPGAGNSRRRIRRAGGLA